MLTRCLLPSVPIPIDVPDICSEHGHGIHMTFNLKDRLMGLKSKEGEPGGLWVLAVEYFFISLKE